MEAPPIVFFLAALLYTHGLPFSIVRKYDTLSSQPIRALTVGVSKLVSVQDEIGQISLFDTENEKRSRQDKLEQIVDGLRKKHGADTIRPDSQENREIGGPCRGADE